MTKSNRERLAELTAAWPKEPLPPPADKVYREIVEVAGYELEGAEAVLDNALTKRGHALRGDHLAAIREAAEHVTSARRVLDEVAGSESQ